MTSPNLIGFELLEGYYQEEFEKKENRWAGRIHWALILGGLRCIGVGESKELNDTDVGSELLPDGWADEPDYKLRYTWNGKLFNLRITIVGDDALVNLIRVSDLKIASVAVPMGKTPVDFKPSSLMAKVESSIFSVFEKPKPAEPSKFLEDRRSRGIPDMRGGIMPGINPLPLNVGRADLDPFAPFGSSGMLLDRNRFLPGIRYDPIGPTPDHMMPPHDRFL